jgi:hypothetical protein
MLKGIIMKVLKAILKFIYNSIIIIITIPLYIFLGLIILLIAVFESIKIGETTLKLLMTEIRKNRKSYSGLFKSDS